MEKWIKVKGYETAYEVSNHGNVKSIKHNIILKGRDDGRGYLKVALYKNGIAKNFRIHRLVLQHFSINDDKAKIYVNHKDLDKSNNTLENLEWCTAKENMLHSHSNQTIKFNSNHLTDEEVLAVRLEWKENKSNLSYSLLSKKYNVSERYLESILQYRRRKNINMRQSNVIKFG